MSMKFFSSLVLFCCLLFLPTLSNAQIVGKSLKLSKKQLKSLNESLPLKVRNFLETADKFEVFVQAERKNGKLKITLDENYVPNIKSEITDKSLRNKLLTAFYQDSIFGDVGAACYLPNHTILATKGEQKVAIEICYGCGKYYVEGSLGKFNGGFNSETKSDIILKEILTKDGIDIK